MKQDIHDATNRLTVPLVDDAESSDAMLVRPDQIILKSMPVSEKVALIREKLEQRVVRRPADREQVACLLERDALITIGSWLSAVR